MPMIVLDASALIAFVQREPGGARVQSALRSSVISAVNFTEVSNKLHGNLGNANGAIAVSALEPLLQEIPPYSASDCAAASAIHAGHRNLGLSLGDCICLALGQKLGADVWTCDRAWAQLDPAYRVIIR